jgi:hypothetical protein
MAEYRKPMVNCETVPVTAWQLITTASTGIYRRTGAFAQRRTWRMQEESRVQPELGFITI